jgi:hypothetical protein
MAVAIGRKLKTVAAVVGAAAMAVTGFTTIAALTSSASAQAQDWVETWSVVLPDAGHPVSESSPMAATLDGEPAVVVGDGAGDLYALSLATGGAIPGWPARTGVPILSTPSVAALGPGSPDDTVFVGVGGPADPHEGGYEAFNPDGTVRWSVAVKNPASDHSAGPTSAVMASLAVGDLQAGGPDVVAPSVGQVEYALNAATGQTLAGFPWFTADSGFSTPALADLDGDGQTDIVEGGDQTAGLSYGVTYTKGGHLRVISPTGTLGTESPTGGLDCEYNPDQGVESSPAVGQFLADGQVGIAVGTSHAFKGALDTDKLYAFGTQCQSVWQVTLNGATESSPALADLAGDGSLDVVEGTDGGPGQGSAYALNGANGAVLWEQNVGQVIGGLVTVDLGAEQDVVVPTTNSALVLDGSDGHVMATLAPSLGLQNSPLVTDDPNGTIGITLAGYNGHNQGQVDHFELAGSSGAGVDGVGAWPMFHHDPQLTGDALTSGPQGTYVPVGARCQAPAGGPNGYYEVGIAGNVFRFGNLAMCGSLPAADAAIAVVGIAATPDGGGYWVVDRVGRVYPFGDARSYGPAHDLADDIVGMAATPDGGGYWLVGARGEVYAYGDAKWYGPSHTLAGPIVGLAATTDGEGYWLAGADGAVYGFGNATVGSHLSLSSVVGIAADAQTGGYWLVDSRGLVSAFDAAFLGSVPAEASEHGVTGIQATPEGYRLVDSGGALFCFGTSTQLGSAYSDHPRRAVVGIAAP